MQCLFSNEIVFKRNLFSNEIVLVSIGVKIITVFEQEKMQDYKFLKVLQCLFRE